MVAKGLSNQYEIKETFSLNHGINANSSWFKTKILVVPENKIFWKTFQNHDFLTIIC